MNNKGKYFTGLTANPFVLKNAKRLANKEFGDIAKNFLPNFSLFDEADLSDESSSFGEPGRINIPMYMLPYSTPAKRDRNFK